MSTPPDREQRRAPAARHRHITLDDDAAPFHVPPDMTAFVQSLVDMFSTEMRRRHDDDVDTTGRGPAALEAELPSRGFLLAASHRLRTRLAGVLGTAVTLEQRLDALTPEESRELIGRLARNARELDGLLGNIIDVERLQRGTIDALRHPTNVLDLIRDVVRRIDHAVPAVQLDGEPQEVPVDSAMVQRIIANLVRNARQHTPPGTAVWIRVRPQGSGVRIAVEDDGPGIPLSLRELMFEPFSRGPSATPHDPGLGIGLTLVARFAELHGGRAWIEGRRGGGTAVNVLLDGGDV